MECTQDAHDAYNARVDAAHARMVWAPPAREQLVQELRRTRDDELALPTRRLLMNMTSEAALDACVTVTSRDCAAPSCR